MTTEEKCALLGKRVEVSLERPTGHAKTVTIGKLLAWDDHGECVVEADSGEVVYCWPMLTVREIS